MWWYDVTDRNYGFHHYWGKCGLTVFYISTSSANSCSLCWCTRRAEMYVSVVWSDEGHWGGGADEHCTTKQGHTEGHLEEHYCTQRNSRPHPPCFLSLHEMRRRRLLLFTDWLPYLEVKIDRSSCHLLFYVLWSTLSVLTPLFLPHCICVFPGVSWKVWFPDEDEFSGWCHSRRKFCFPCSKVLL